MKEVASLRYDVIFKKAFGVPEIFTAFVRDLLGIELEIDTVEKDKAYDPPIGSVATKFDLYAEDKKNRIIVDIQHVRYPDHYHRFLHYHCAALFRPKFKVFTIVVLTSGDKHKKDIGIIDFDPKDLQGQAFGEIDHKVVYICPKYLDKKVTPKRYHEWLEAIEDSLDEQVDESHYTQPEIQQIFNMIQKDQVTPEERARMFDEYGEEQVKQEKFLKEVEKQIKQIKEDAAQAKEESARKLKQLSVLTDEQIASVTGLSLEMVKALS